jgi:hypothetical protein
VSGSAPLAPAFSVELLSPVAALPVGGSRSVTLCRGSRLGVFLAPLPSRPDLLGVALGDRRFLVALSVLRPAARVLAPSVDVDPPAVASVAAPAPLPPVVEDVRPVGWEPRWAARPGSAPGPRFRAPAPRRSTPAPRVPSAALAALGRRGAPLDVPGVRFRPAPRS